jgi:uncharacterized membrane protein
MRISLTTSTPTDYFVRTVLATIATGGLVGVILWVVSMVTLANDDTAQLTEVFLALCVSLAITGYNTGMWIMALVVRRRKPRQALPPHRLAWSVAGVVLVALMLWLLMQLEPASGSSDDFGPGFVLIVLGIGYVFAGPLIAACISVNVLANRSHKK